MPKHQRDKRKNRKGGGEPYESGEIPDQQKRGSGRHGKSKGRSRGGGGFASIHTPCTTFDEMNLKPDLLKGIYAYGFEKPSAIQQRAIKPIVQGRDVIAQSQSGTGKTAVFSIASLQLLDETSRDVQVLVLSPTRELAEQSQRVMQSLGDFMNVRNITRFWNKGNSGMQGSNILYIFVRSLIVCITFEFFTIFSILFIKIPQHSGQLPRLHRRKIVGK